MTPLAFYLAKVRVHCRKADAYTATLQGINARFRARWGRA